MSIRPLLSLLGVVLFASACLSYVDAGRIRKVTYPPDFHYITKAEIKGTMGELAALIVELDALMLRETTLAPAEQERVLQILTRMDRLAQQLQSGTRTNHPRLDRAAPWLQRDVTRALAHARSKPPSYYFAGQVSGACSYCHVPPVDTPRRPAGAAGQG